MESQASSHTLVTLQIDEIKPKKVTLIGVVLIFLLGLFFILSAIVPSAVIRITPSAPGFCIENLNQVSNLPNCASAFNLSIEANPVYMNRIFNTTGLNQMIWVSAYFHSHNNLPGHGGNCLFPYVAASLINIFIEFTVNFHYTLSVYELTSDTTVGVPILEPTNHTVYITCPEGEALCEEKAVVMIPQIKHSSYLIIIHVQNATQYNTLLSSANFQTWMIQEQFSKYLLALRYTFGIVSMITYAIFMWRMRGIRMFRDWIMEQKAIMVLGAFLVLFNNPFYAINIILPGEGSFFFATLFTVNFAIFLYGFWLTAFQRIRSENQMRKTKTLTVGKFLFLFLLWLFVLVSLLLLNHIYLEDPGFDFGSEKKNAYFVFKVIAIILCSVALLWLLVEVIYVVKSFRTRIWRHKLLFVFSAFFMLAFFLYIFSLFDRKNENGTSILLVIALSNLYIYLLQLLYTPTDKGVWEAQQVRRVEKRPTEMQYDVLEDNINIEFRSPYSDHQGIQMQQHEAEEDPQMMQHFQIEENEDDSHEKHD